MKSPGRSLVPRKKGEFISLLGGDNGGCSSSPAIVLLCVHVSALIPCKV